MKMKITRKIRSVLKAAFTTLFAVATLSQAMADETISVDTQLSADMTVDGTLYLKNGATLDLNGHSLSVKALARPVVEGEDVPGYSFIESVESTGHQWLYSDYTPAGSDRVEMKLELTGTPSTSSEWWILFCSRGAGNVNSFMAGIGGTTKFRVDHKASGTTTGTTYSPGFSKGGVYEISVDGNTGACKVNGSTVLTTTTGEYDTATGPFSILGAHAQGADLLEAKRGTDLGFIPKCKIYSFKVTDTNNVVQCDMVPAIRISDSAVGMYDRERNMFIENYGTAALIPGYIDVAITNSASSISSLIVNGASTNDVVKVTGNVRLVKTGAGTYLPTKAGQTYTGGTIVSNGVVSVKGNGTTALLGTAGGNLVRNGGFDGEGTVVPKNNKKDWNYASASGFNCPEWTMSNPSYMGLSGPATGLWISNQTQINEIMGAYGFFMKTTDTDGKGHSGDLSLEQSGLPLTRGRYRISYNYTTRADVNHAPATHSVNLVRGGVSKRVGEITVQYAERTKYNYAEWFFEIGEGEDGVYTLQFLQTIADNGSAEKTTVLDNIVVEKLAAEVVVESGAMVELASGARDLTDCRFTMNGGTLKCSADTDSAALVSDVRLTTDSYWEHTAKGGFIGRDSGTTQLDLGGHTLTIISENSSYLYFKNTTVTEGIVVFPEHLWFAPSSDDGVNATNATFDVTALIRPYGTLSLGNYVARRSASTYARDPSKILVYRTLAPVGAPSDLSCTLQDGSTIDFSQATGSLTAATTGGIQFAANATVTIRLGDSHLSNPIISWTTAPSNINTVTFVRDASESSYKLEARSDGLYAVRKGFMLIVK